MSERFNPYDLNDVAKIDQIINNRCNHREDIGMMETKKKLEKALAIIEEMAECTCLYLDRKCLMCTAIDMLKEVKDELQTM